VALDPRDHYFMTQRFEHGARYEVMKHEIVKRLGIGFVVTTHIHMESGAIKKGMTPLGGWKLSLFGETIVDIKFKLGPTVDLDGPFCMFKYRDIWNQVE
jgi:hypothetical protein